MKKNIFCLFLIVGSCFLKAQTNADCINSIPLCSTPNFTFFPVVGNGNVNDIPNGSNISNPTSNPNPPNSGCLLAGENNPQWLLITVGSTGMLEFVFGAGNSPNPQAGYYDWSMWPYSPTACANIMNNTLPPVRCNWNAISSGGTGIASPGNIPPGGNAGNYQPPLAVNACQQFIICISNYSNINTLVSFQNLGTATLSCNPNCNPSFSICAGSNVTITAINFANLTNPTFSIQPGGQTNLTGTFVVSPTVTTSYTTYVTGMNGVPAVQTTTGVSNVTVNPKPFTSPTFTQATCSNSLNAVNLGLTFLPTNPIPGYTVNWSPIPPGPPTPTQTSASNLLPGTTNVTVTAAGGCSTTLSFTMAPSPPPVTFTINNLTGSASVTCLNPTVVLQAVSNYTFGTISYTWSSPSFTSTSSTVSLTAANSLTLNGIDPATGCSFQQTIAIGINTTVPTNSVAPLSQAITCATVTPVTFSGTCSNPTINLQHDWYSPLNPLPGGVPIATSNNTISILSGVIPPGVYTLQTTNLVNGCKAFKTVTVTSLDAWPTFGINSSTNYSVGCSPLNQTTLSIINPVSTQTPASTCSFTFLPPGFGGTLAVGPYSGNTSTITTLPGTWTVIVNDNSNNCKTILSVPIIQNTVAPNVAVTMTAPIGNQTLTCRNPTLLATGSSTTTNAQINWLQPIAPPLVSTATILVGPGSGPNTSTTSLVYANYTVISTNTVNACVTTSVVVISQNFKPPVSSPTISIGTPTAIYCTSGSNPVVLTTGSSTTTSNGGPLAFPVPVLWEGPSPQATTTGVSSYSCYVPGIYSLTIQDNYNGCFKTGTINILDRTQPPVITNPVSTATIDCGGASGSMSLTMTGTTTGGVKYLVKRYPLGSTFTPTNAILLDINPILSGTSSSVIAVSKPGQYVYVISNTLTGCTAEGTVNVSSGGLVADFDPSSYSGYAPLDVSFNNISTSSLGSQSITSIWSFGNGLTYSNTINNVATTSYAAPGNYTVMLIAQKGGCIDTVYKVIRVDIPSKLEVPNVFTPNGDGSNDVFFMKTANLSEINAIIFDRWGNKVYETNSTSGNIAWDGKNLQGKECASGVYFYVITAKGKDEKEYNTKGNVTLFR